MQKLVKNLSLSQRDGKLSENWFVICLSREIKSRPLQRILYDKAYVIFRNSQGKIAVFPDRCLHRHAQLSKGDIIRGQLACAYHGWVYDADGQVVEVPSEGPKNSEKKHPCIESLPVVVQDGCVWVWLGAEMPTTEKPPYRFPSFDRKNYRNYFMITDFQNEVTNLAENFMDVPHTVFVHRGWFRDRRQVKIPIRVETENANVLVTYEQKSDQIGFWGRALNPKNFPMLHTDRFVMPNITRVDYEFGPDHGFTISSQISPVSTLKSRVYTEIAYNIAYWGWALSPVLRYYTRKVITQDVEIMQNQGENLARNMESNFQHTDADIVHQSIEDLREHGIRGEDFHSINKDLRCDIWV